MLFFDKLEHHHTVTKTSPKQQNLSSFFSHPNATSQAKALSKLAKPDHNIGLNEWIDAKLSLAVYGKHAPPPGFKPVETFHRKPYYKNLSLLIAAKGLHAVAYRNDKLKQIVIAVRGTDNIYNWISGDLDILKGRGPVYEIEVLTPFVQSIKSKLPSGYTLRLTGHSLGASIATYFNLTNNIKGNVFECPGIAAAGNRFTEQQWAKQTSFNFKPNIVTAFNHHPMNKVELYRSIAVEKKIAALERDRNWKFLTGNPGWKKVALEVQVNRHSMYNIILSINQRYRPPSYKPKNQPAPITKKRMVCSPI